MSADQDYDSDYSDDYNYIVRCLTKLEDKMNGLSNKYGETSLKARIKAIEDSLETKLKIVRAVEDDLDIRIKAIKEAEDLTQARIKALEDNLRTLKENMMYQNIPS